MAKAISNNGNGTTTENFTMPAWVSTALTYEVSPENHGKGKLLSAEEIGRACLKAVALILAKANYKQAKFEINRLWGQGDDNLIRKTLDYITGIRDDNKSKILYGTSLLPIHSENGQAKLPTMVDRRKLFERVCSITTTPADTVKFAGLYKYQKEAAPKKERMTDEVFWKLMAKVETQAPLQYVKALQTFIAAKGDIRWND